MKTGSVAGFATAEDEKEAESIAKALLGKKLAACCNIIPNVKSDFWWKGKLEKAEEVLLIIKTRKGLADEVIEEIKSVHSYEVPAIEFLDISKGNPDFLKWIEDETGEGK
jgi:periplasmic divalent cation tolerance protein